MPGLLEGQIAQAIYKGFKGKLLKAQLRRETSAPSGGLDAHGDPLATTGQTWSCEGFTEAYSEFYRAQAGIPETDLKVNLFAASLPAGIRPAKDDQVRVTRAGAQTWYQLRKDATDPAEALWVCQAYQIPDPTA